MADSVEFGVAITRATFGRMWVRGAIQIEQTGSDPDTFVYRVMNILVHLDDAGLTAFNQKEIVKQAINVSQIEPR